jgi:hypothetical protein
MAVTLAGIPKHPNNSPMSSSTTSGKNMRWSMKMELLIPLGILVIWFVLQVWVLPRFGVKT